jgi:hypothetical protein
MTLHYLDGKKASVNETAYLVGFSDASTFSRGEGEPEKAGLYIVTRYCANKI